MEASATVAADVRRLTLKSETVRASLRRLLRDEVARLTAISPSLVPACRLSRFPFHQQTGAAPIRGYTACHLCPKQSSACGHDTSRRRGRTNPTCLQATADELRRHHPHAVVNRPRQ